MFDYTREYDRPTMHVCYNVNDPFISIMGASIVSIVENNKDWNLVFHVFTDGFSEHNARLLESLAKQCKMTVKLYVLRMQAFADFHIKVARF